MHEQELNNTKFSIFREAYSVSRYPSDDCGLSPLNEHHVRVYANAIWLSNTNSTLWIICICTVYN